MATKSKEIYQSTKNFVTAVNYLTEQKGLKQKDIAASLHISEQTLSTYMALTNNVTNKMLAKLAETYKVSPDFLLMSRGPILSGVSGDSYKLLLQIEIPSDQAQSVLNIIGTNTINIKKE